MKRFRFNMREVDIDFVLVWDDSNEVAISQESSLKRQVFQRHLTKEGLQLEEETIVEGSGQIHVVKIRAPIEVLKRYTEILKLRMPMKDVSEFIQSAEDSNNALFDPPSSIPKKSWWSCLTKRLEVDPNLFPTAPAGFSATYSRDKEYLFDIRNPDKFFNHGIRSLIIDFILRRSSYIEKQKRHEVGDDDSEQPDFGIGIEPLLSEGIYCGAYPLHDGEVKTPGCLRNLLFKEWAGLSNSLKYQPLGAVNTYFGLKIATYFAWLGFYTEMLIPVAILGVVAFLYGVFTLPTNAITNDICGGRIVEPMCPHCDRYCGYKSITETCVYSKIMHLLDNDATVIFSILSSFWTIIYLERWKRYSAEIKYRWDLNSIAENDQNPRPNYLTRLRKANKKKKNVMSSVPTGEPSLDFWRTKLPNMIISLSTVLFLVFLALAAVVSVILYRLAVKFVLLSRYSAPTDHSVHGWGLIVANMTAVCLNLCFIVFFNWLYSFVAMYLTELELHRTQADFDDSLTLKMYLLQFINYYSSIFYIAFFKGKFAGTPPKYKYLWGYRQEECVSGGCMAELCIQLSIVMVGNQAVNAFFEMGKPFAARWFKTRWKKSGDGVLHTTHSQAGRDMSLTPWTTLSLFPEYLEMVIQFGFSTIFVSAFPLAPFFALINNIFEIRLDAYKLLVYYQRPVGAQVSSIGIWYDILNSITKLAVLTNAFIIAFTSTFIPRLIHRMEFGNLDNFLKHSLASFNTSEFCEESRPIVEEHPDACRYYSFTERNFESQSDGSRIVWEIWVARVIFIVLYQNGIFFGVMLIQWMIPDVPQHVQEKIRQENYLINKIVIKKERDKSRAAASDGTNDEEGFSKGHQNQDSEDERL